MHRTIVGSVIARCSDFISGGKTGIIAPRNDAADTRSHEGVVYYNLNGQRIQRPSSGLVIIHKGGNARKVVIR